VKAVKSQYWWNLRWNINCEDTPHFSDSLSLLSENCLPINFCNTFVSYLSSEWYLLHTLQCFLHVSKNKYFFLNWYYCFL
jgi:hypothetical protein